MAIFKEFRQGVSSRALCSYFKRMEIHLFDIFDHKMGIEELNSPLFRERVLHCKHERFPKEVALVVTKHAYGKLFYLLARDKVEKESNAIKMVELLLELEDEFGVQFNNGAVTLESSKSIATIVKLVEEKQS